MREYRIIKADDAVKLGMPLSGNKTDPWVCLAVYRNGRYDGIEGWFYRSASAQARADFLCKQLTDLKKNLARTLNNVDNLNVST